LEDRLSALFGDEMKKHRQNSHTDFARYTTGKRGISSDFPIAGHDDCAVWAGGE